MDERIETGWLFAFYGPLLTARQQKLLSLWCEEDLSLSEIAQSEGISRQAVFDTVRKAQEKLRALEGALGLAERYREMTNGLRRCIDKIHDVPGGRAREVEAMLRDLLAREEEDDGL